jgi:uncharacterized delta-60 repeat protein
MIVRTWLVDLETQFNRFHPLDRQKPKRRRRSIRLVLEGLEERALLSLPPGSPDPTFGNFGQVTGDFGGQGVGAGALQRDGKIVGVDVESMGGMPTIGMARFLPNGKLDTTFAASNGGEAVLDPGLMFGDPEAVAVIDGLGLPDDGKIVVAGGWGDPTTSQSGVALARFNAEGTLDLGFGNGGVVIDTRTTIGASALVIQPDGKILVAGMTLKDPTAERGFVERFNEDGTPDAGFANPGIATAPPGWLFQSVSALTLDPTLGLFVAGFTLGAADIAVAHLTTGGQLDASFGSGGTATTAAGTHGEALYGLSGLAIDPTRGLVVTATTTPEGSPPFYGDRAVVVRFNFQGTIDRTFNNGAVEVVDFVQPSQASNESARAVAVQTDGRVLVAGTNLGQRGGTALELVRLNSDGSRDSDFGSGGVVETLAPFGGAPRSVFCNPTATSWSPD